MMETTIVPIVQIKCGNITDSNNSIPVALATVVSKLVESVILLASEYYLTTSVNQYGFKTGHSMDLCIYVFLKLLKHYSIQYTTVFVIS